MKLMAVERFGREQALEILENFGKSHDQETMDMLKEAGILALLVFFGLVALQMLISFRR